ncbi:hypothetical protein F5I97DRAFT_1966169 [Phlebopus sp. FC_14]|nr:hypothetical protein F5I97DRAFT_1966169 [Phlebopus sp. FC_14]
MSIRYAPIPSPRNEPDTDPELDAAFDDDDDDEENNVDESVNNVPLTSSSSHGQTSTHSHAPLTYDFNSPIPDHDYYDQPPPGSPPPPTSLAIPNAIGNSNGIVPTFTLNTLPQPTTSWWRRTAGAVLPSYYVQRFGLTYGSAARGRVMGGGTGNDGVFSNVSAKPSATGVRVQEGDNIFIVPEETSSTPPPSYASAQADAAPPYHTSTLLLPFSPHSLSSSLTQGSVLVDALPTGTLFAFLWNALVSTTFQFIGFVLTWVMHTTHAAKFGSRAGLGITLIQWGFGLRSRLEDSASGGATAVWEDTNGRPSFGSTKEAEDYYNNLGLLNSTSTDMSMPTSTQGMDQLQGQWDNSVLTGPLATEWLSFFLMTAGWFLLLTSSLGFWRVKRWERSILASNSSSSAETSFLPGHTRTRSEVEDEDNENRRQSLFERLGLFRPSSLARHQPTEHNGRAGSEVHLPLMPLDGNGGEGVVHGIAQGEMDDGGRAATGQDEGVHPRYADPDLARRVREAIEREQRLCNDLRYAGLL